MTRVLFITRTLWLALALLFMDPTPLLAQNNADVDVARLLSVTDGDTIRVTIAAHARWPEIIGNNIPVRIAGIDAPELKGRCYREIAMARAARKLLRQQFKGARKVTLTNISRGKYFRLIATVLVDGRDVSRALLTHGLARPYNGKEKRKGWCP